MASIFDNMTCVKRDGKIEKFNLTKIFNAIQKANKSMEEPYPNTILNTVTATIGSYITGLRVDSLGVEEIQDIVVNHLMEHLPKIATEYITYRYKRALARDKDIVIIDKYKARVECKDVQNSNANVDEWSFSGREKEAAADVSKTIAIEFGGLSPKIAKAHKDMLIYQHDLEKAIYGVHNCLFTNMEKTLSTGFKTRNGEVRPPKTFATAAQQVPVHFQLGSLCQFGGIATIHLDTDLAPFVKLSFLKHYRNGLRYIEDRPDTFIDANFPKTDTPMGISDPKYKDHRLVYKYAMDMLNEEMKQGSEALYHNLNTLESRSGSQLPFTSSNLGRDTSEEGRLVTKAILNASISGIGKHHTTPIFPISIFQYKKGVNANEGDPNYDLMQLALDSLSRRIYPNFINCDFSEAHEDPNDLDTLFAGMGKHQTAHVKLQ